MMKARLITIALLTAVLLLNAGFRALERQKGALLEYAATAILRSIEPPPPPANAAKPPARARCRA